MRILILSLFLAVFFTGCAGGASTKALSNRTESIDFVMSREDKELLLKYRQEGFADLNSYSVIIVRPIENEDTLDEITEQAQRRSFVSFQKYLRERGVRIDSNTNTKLLNLINEKGSLKRIQDKEKSRIVYIFVVEEDGLKRNIDSIK